MEVIFREVFFVVIYLAFVVAPIAAQFSELSGVQLLLITLAPYVTFQALRYHYSIRRKESFAAYIEYYFLNGLRYAGVLMVFGGIALFLWQVWMYLKYGYWNEMPLLSWAPSYIEEWVINPTSWLGLSKIIGSILSSVSAPFTLCLAGVPFILLEPNLEELKELHAEKRNNG